MRNLPRGSDSSFLGGYPGEWDPHGSKSDRFKELFALLDFRTEKQILAMSISTISKCQNCSIPVSVDPGGANLFPHIWTPPGIIMTFRVCSTGCILLEFLACNLHILSTKSLATSRSSPCFSQLPSLPGNRLPPQLRLCFKNTHHNTLVFVFLLSEIYSQDKAIILD